MAPGKIPGGTVLLPRGRVVPQGLHLKGGGLYFAIFIEETTPETVITADNELLFQKGPVKTDKYPPAAFVLHMDLQGFHPAKAEPVMGQDPDHGTYRGETVVVP
jgi:hypothetical protein